MSGELLGNVNDKLLIPGMASSAGLKPEGVHIGWVYRNLKTQQLYRVEGFVKHSETQEAMVLYYPVDGKGRWDRPLNSFVKKFEGPVDLTSK